MPNVDKKEYASSASRPKQSGSSTEEKRTSQNPAASRRPVAMSGSARLNGPGTPGGGVGRSRPAASAPRISTSQALRERSRQASIASDPPGRSAWPMFANAATGSAKNIAAEAADRNVVGRGFEGMHLRVGLLEAHVVETLCGRDASGPGRACATRGRRRARTRSRRLDQPRCSARPCRTRRRATVLSAPRARAASSARW